MGVHFDHSLTFSGSRIDLIVDVFNLFNQQEALDYEHAFEVSSELSNPDFGKTRVFQSPRQIRFAARSSF